MPRIAFIAYQNCLASSIFLPLEMFSAAEDIHRLTHRGDKPSDEPKIFGSSRRVNSAGGIELITRAHPREIENVDLILLPAIWRNPVPVIQKNRYLLALLKTWHAKGVMLCAVGTGSSFFAEAGLLTQRPATSHWAYLDNFRKRYPQVQLQKDFLITQADRLFCAGSVNAIGDLVIYFIESLYSTEIAKRVESNFSPEVRQSYASNIYREGEHTRHTDEDIVRLIHWLKESYALPIKASDMAAFLGISIRSLNRRFKQATNLSPKQYLQQLRYKHARELLKNTNLSVGELAEQLGYNDAAYFCREFKKTESITPMQYRQTVRNKLFA